MKEFFEKICYVFFPGLYQIDRGTFPWPLLFFFFLLSLGLFHSPEIWPVENIHLYQRYGVIISVIVLGFRSSFLLKKEKNLSHPDFFYLGAVILCLIGFQVIANGRSLFLASVDDGSMYPILEASEIVLVQGEVTSFSHGDIVAFVDPQKEKVLFRKIYALGGEEFQVQNGELIVNGKVIKNVSGLGLQSTTKAEVPFGRILWLAESKQESSAQFVWGLANQKEIYGKALRIKKSASVERENLQLSSPKKFLGQ